jgi:hypothetical protein
MYIKHNKNFNNIFYQNFLKYIFFLLFKFYSFYSIFLLLIHFLFYFLVFSHRIIYNKKNNFYTSHDLIFTQLLKYFYFQISSLTVFVFISQIQKYCFMKLRRRPTLGLLVGSALLCGFSMLSFGSR